MNQKINNENYKVMELEKNCTGCKEMKPLSLFGKDSFHKDGLSYQCKPCKAKVSRLYRLNNKEVCRESNKNSRYKEMCSIIYAIKTKEGVYVGSTTEGLRRRLSKHTSALNLNKHKNPLLQSIYNKHGLSTFDFEILEFIEDNSNLVNREQYWIDKHFANSLNIARAC